MYLWCVLYLMSLYAIQLVVAAPFMWDAVPFRIDLVIALALLSVLLGVVGIGLAMVGLGRRGTDVSLPGKLRRVALLLKLLSIPFFFFHLASWAVVSAAFLVVPGLQFLLFSGVLGVAFAYGVLLVGSVFSVSTMYMAFRSGCLKGTGFAWGVVSQLIFVVDVIVYIGFYFWSLKDRRREKGGV
ncbi:MAG: hypothetical protein ACOX7N_03180 [Lawsonibacter sp.]|jgi:hypothetical protein